MAVPGGVLVPTVLCGLGEAAVLLRRLHGEHQPQPGGLKGLHHLRHICPHRVGRPADRGKDRRRRDRTGQDRRDQRARGQPQCHLVSEDAQPHAQGRAPETDRLNSTDDLCSQHFSNVWSIVLEKLSKGPQLSLSPAPRLSRHQDITTSRYHDIRTSIHQDIMTS